MIIGWSVCIFFVQYNFFTQIAPKINTYIRLCSYMILDFASCPPRPL